jgi:hypothetical protein
LKKLRGKYFKDGYDVKLKFRIGEERDLELSFLDRRNMHVGNLRLMQRNYPSWEPLSQ